MDGRILMSMWSKSQHTFTLETKVCCRLFLSSPTVVAQTWRWSGGCVLCANWASCWTSFGHSLWHRCTTSSLTVEQNHLWPSLVEDSGPVQWTWAELTQNRGLLKACNSHQIYFRTSDLSIALRMLRDFLFLSFLIRASLLKHNEAKDKNSMNKQYPSSFFFPDSIETEKMKIKKNRTTTNRE